MKIEVILPLYTLPIRAFSQQLGVREYRAVDLLHPLDEHLTAAPNCCDPTLDARFQRYEEEPAAAVAGVGSRLPRSFSLW